MFTIRVNKKIFILFLICLLGIITYLIFIKTQPDTSPLKTSLSNMGKNVLQSQTVYAAIDIEKYTKPPYNLPPPKGEATITYSSEAINNANTLGNAIADIQPYLLKNYQATHVDPFLAVMWTMAIEGSGADPYFWNCNETYKGKENISRGCRGWYNSGNWQVGYGIQVAQAGSHLVEDFMEIYKSADAQIAQEVGNRVIQSAGITNPSSFPAKSIEQLVQEAGSPGTMHIERPTTDTEAAAQQAIAILLMDPKIGAAAIAQEVANDIGSDWAGTMRGWNQDHYTNGLNPDNPTFSNNIRELAKVYTGKAGSSDGSVGGGSFTLSLVLKPTKDDVYVTNIATAYAIGGGGGSGTSSATTGPLNPDATCPGEGPITCGTRAGSSQASACHCTASYEANVTGCNGYCSWCHPPDDGAVYAIDIANPLDAPVFIPKISVGGEVRTVTCIGYGNQSGSTEPNQVIQILSCSDDKTDEAVWMQFHHSKKSNPVTEGKTYKSGETVGYSAAMEVFASDPHVHYQIGVGGPCGAGGTASCRNADEFVQCN